MIIQFIFWCHYLKLFVVSNSKDEKISSINRRAIVSNLEFFFIRQHKYFRPAIWWINEAIYWLPHKIQVGLEHDLEIQFLAYLTLLDYWSSCKLREISWTISLLYCDQLLLHLCTTNAFGCFCDIMAQFEILKDRFLNNTVAYSSMWLSNYMQTEAMHKI